jgi:hypothetical protein
MRELLLVLMLLATIAQAAIMRQRLQRERDIVTTRESVKKLAAITLQVFKGQDPPVGMAFWQGLNRTEPMYDLWGQEYRLEVLTGETHKEFIWQSAGPDRQYGTADDIRARVPYQRGVTLDLTHPEINRDSGPSSSDAN